MEIADEQPPQWKINSIGGACRIDLDVEFNIAFHVSESIKATY
jgi:hypothetical protein